MNVFELFAKIDADTSGFESGLDKAKSLGKNVLGGIGNIAKVGFGVASAAIGAGTAAVAAFGTQAVKSYANYEQLVGGVEKLFGESSETIMNNANRAYLTAGMSANQYLETATSFSAALINSLEGDLETAADFTDIAMQAISDNVNVFGSDMESVTNAFKGFSKGQMNMLDNLKLGYGGTKEEMERLLRDAEKYGNLIEGSLDINNFADIVQGIQIVQEEMGVAGTTQKEAMKTIEGSANATKAAWENVITAIGKGEGISDAFGQLTTAIFGTDEEGTGLLAQIIPRVQTTMSGIGEFIGQSAPIISEKLPELIDAVLPSMIEGGISLAGALGEGIINALPSVWETVSGAAGKVGDYLSSGMETAAKATENVDFKTPVSTALDKIDELFNGEKTQKFIANGTTVVSNIAKGIGDAAPDMIPKAAEVVTQFVNGISDNVPQLLEAGGQMVLGLAEGVVKAAPKLYLSLMTLKFKIVGYVFEAGKEAVVKGIEAAKDLIAKVAAVLPQLPEKIAYYAGYAVSRFKTEIDLLPVRLGTAIANAIKKIIDWGKDMKKKGKEVPEDFVKEFFNVLDDMKNRIWEKAKAIGEAFVNGIKGVIKGAGNLFEAATEGAKAGKEDAQKNVLQAGYRRTTLITDTGIYDDNGFNTSETGFNYEKLANAIVRAFIAADIKIECDDREFGRLIRKAVTA